jgi:hypothetical protein
MAAEKVNPESQRENPFREMGEERRHRLLEDARRPMAVNLAEGLAFSEWLSTYTGDAKTPEEQLKAFRAAQKDVASEG